MGASGSKAPALHKSTIRVVAAAANKAPLPSGVSAVEAGVSAAERQREAELRQRQQALSAAPSEQAQDNEPLVHTMGKVMAGMRQYQYELYRNPEVDRKYAVKKKTREEKEAENIGRLDIRALQQLLTEHAASLEQGSPLSVAELAQRYGAEEATLREVLQYVAVPVVQAAEDGQPVGRWPGQRADK